MTRRRATVRVSDLVVKINGMIAATPDAMARERSALATVVESVLFDTGNYRGFTYLESEYSTSSDRDGFSILRPDHDDTRRRYYA